MLDYIDENNKFMKIRSFEDILASVIENNSIENDGDDGSLLEPITQEEILKSVAIFTIFLLQYEGQTRIFKGNTRNQRQNLLKYIF